MAAPKDRVVAEAPAGYTGEGGLGQRGASGSGAGAAAGPLTGTSLAALAVKFGERQRSPHYLLVKEHQVREGTDTAHPPRRTLFVLNVPPYCSPVSGVGAGPPGGGGHEPRPGGGRAGGRGHLVRSTGPRNLACLGEAAGGEAGVVPESRLVRSVV